MLPILSAQKNKPLATSEVRATGLEAKVWITSKCRDFTFTSPNELLCTVSRETAPPGGHSDKFFYLNGFCVIIQTFHKSEQSFKVKGTTRHSATCSETFILNCSIASLLSRDTSFIFFILIGDFCHQRSQLTNLCPFVLLRFMMIGLIFGKTEKKGPRCLVNRCESQDCLPVTKHVDFPSNLNPSLHWQ